LEEETIVELKAYFRKLWILTPEVERTAVAEIGRLAAKPAVRAAIAGYAADGRFPWEGRG
jgi:polyketide biosynthesis enoyl-CoA hydratase PksH